MQRRVQGEVALGGWLKRARMYEYATRAAWGGIGTQQSTHIPGAAVVSAPLTHRPISPAAAVAAAPQKSTRAKEHPGAPRGCARARALQGGRPLPKAAGIADAVPYVMKETGREQHGTAKSGDARCASCLFVHPERQ